MLTSLTIRDFKPFYLGISCTVITIADAQIWYQCIQALRGSQTIGDGNYIHLESNYKECKISDGIQFVGDIAFCESLDDLFLKTTLEVLRTKTGDRETLQFHRKLQELQDIALQAIWEHDIPLSLENEVDLLGFLKLCKPHIHTVDSSVLELPNDSDAELRQNWAAKPSIYAKMMEIIEIAGALEIQQTLVLLHMCKYVNDDQMQVLLSRLHDLQIQIIDLELDHQIFDMPVRIGAEDSNLTVTDGNFPELKSYYIDADFVQF